MTGVLCCQSVVVFLVFVPVPSWLYPVIFVSRWIVHRVFIISILHHFSGFRRQLHSPSTTSPVAHRSPCVNLPPQCVVLCGPDLLCLFLNKHLLPAFALSLFVVVTESHWLICVQDTKSLWCIESYGIWDVQVLTQIVLSQGEESHDKDCFNKCPEGGFY